MLANKALLCRPSVETEQGAYRIGRVLVSSLVRRSQLFDWCELRYA